MALTGALFAGVSGINANGNAMNIIGDNIANVQTIGFKSSRAVFFDLLSADIGGTKVGLGTRLADAQRPFVQGGVETTNSPTDMAIQGRGLFVLRDTAGASFYSRAGQFVLDDQGNLVNPSGLRVQGFGLDSAGNINTGLNDIVINQSVVGPTPTSIITSTVNLDATSTPPIPTFPVGVPPSGLPAAWFAGANFSTVLTVFDSLGQGHDLTYLFRKTAANTWDYRVTANAAEVGGTAGNLQQVGNGTLVFNANGSLNTGTPANITAAWANGASAQTITAANQIFLGTTQYAQASSVSVLNQDRLIGAPDDGSFGTVLSGSLELSTVDFATEFVKMVTTQRAFQASSRTITVTDTLLEEVSNLKR